MPTTAELLAWAHKHATDLEADMHYEQSSDGHGWWWKANNPTDETKIHVRAITALDFLERFSGNDSAWPTRADELLTGNGHSMETGARALGDVLRAWADQVEAGIVIIPQAEAQGVRTVASTDLMEQVRMLNEDRTVSPAAPIVLAGAALEIALRSAIEELGLEVPPNKRSISGYAEALRSAEALGRQDSKDLTAMGGIRNSAAHGELNVLSMERAALMEQQVNQFLRRLADILESRPV